jgi:hypothetical protein
MTGEKICEEGHWYRKEEIGFGFASGGDLITRYMEMPPNDLIDDCIAYLVGANGCSALTIDGHALEGSWRTAVVVCEPVGPEAGGRSRPMRLSHTIAKLNGAAGTAWAETNCTFVVTVTPYFKQLVVTSPTTGTSGITYSVEGARRDDRTGLWDYLVVKREQLTTTTGIVTVEDDQFKTVYEQTFYGVRTGNLNHLGAAVALWTVGVNPAGTEYETTNVRKNDNCTTDISQRKTVAKEVAELTKRTAKDTYEHLEEVQSVDADPLGAAPAPSAGVITDNTDRKREDGYYERTQRVTTEQDEPDAGAMTEKDVYEHTAETEAVAAAALGAAPAASGGVITNNRSEKTKGGKFRNRQRVTTEQDVSNAAVTSEKGVYEERSVTENVQATALAAAPSPSAGVTVSRRSEKTKGGKFRTREETVTEPEVADAGAMTEKDVFEHTAETEAVEAAALGAAPAASGGVITRNRSDKTKGGRFRNRQTVVTEQDVAAVSTLAQKDQFEAVAVSEAVAGTALADAPSATGGVIKTHRSDKTKGGKFRTREETRTEQAVASAVTEASGDLFDARTRTIARNQASGSAKTPGLSGVGTAGAKVTTVIQKKTPGALIDVDEQEETPGPATVETVTLPFDGDRTVTILIFRNHTKAALQALITASKYYRVSGSPQLNRFGLLDGTLTLSIDAGGGGGDGSYVPYYDEAFTEEKSDVVEIAGKYYKRVYTFTGIMRRDWGLTDGISRYSGAKAGSHFRPLSGNWYEFKKITAISMTDTAITIPASAVAL